MRSGARYISKGDVVATGPEGLRAWLLRNGRDDFEEWLDINIDGMSFATLSVPPSDVIRSLAPEEYMQEMAHWVDNVVMPGGRIDPEVLELVGITAEGIPLDGRTYRIEPIVEPWEVRGDEVYTYYEDADLMEVGDVHSNSAYRVIRTANRAPGRRVR